PHICLGYFMQAVSAPCIRVLPALGVHVQDVVLLTSDKEMIRIDAPRRIAFVAQDFAFADVLPMQDPRCSVRSNASSAQPERAVPGAAIPASPDPAAALGNELHLAQKPFVVAGSHAAALISPRSRCDQ